MAAWLDVCRFSPTAGGTTDWTFSAAVVGYQSPTAAGVVNGAIYRYRAESSDLTQWEIGFGAYNTGTGVLARTTVLYNSAGTGTGAGQSGAGSKINFTLVPQVAVVLLAEDLSLLTAAVQADQETGTSTTVAVVPGVQKHNPLHPKAWAYVTVSGGVYTLAASSGVSGIVKNSTGNVTVTFSTAFSSVNFACIVGCNVNLRTWAVTSRTTTTVVVVTTDDLAGFDLCAFGDL